MTRWSSQAPVAESAQGAPSFAAASDAQRPVPFVGGEPLEAPWLSHDVATARPVQRSATLKRWLRDIALGISLVVALPMAVVAVKFRGVPTVSSSAEQRLRDVEPLRVLRRAVNPTVTPMAAGEAFARITDASHGNAFTTRFGAEAKAQLASIAGPSPELFPTIRDAKRGNALDYARLLALSAGALTAAETAWLQQMAVLPLWRDAEAAASASAVDVVGGRFVLDARSNATLWGMPVPKLNELRRLAQAGVARAAWHVHRGDYDAAEQSLRTVVSLGFVMVDNGASLVEALMGRAVVHIARDGFAQLAALRNDVALQRLTVAPPDLTRAQRNEPVGITFEQDPEAAMASVLDPQAPQTVRMERRMMLTYLQCTSLRQVLFGPSAATRTRLAEVDRALARFTSETALLAQHDRSFTRLPDVIGVKGPQLLLMGAASAASSLTGNPRIAGCLAPVVAWW